MPKTFLTTTTFVSSPHVTTLEVEPTNKKYTFSSFIDVVHLLERMSYREAICDPLWQGYMAMSEELVALHQIHTWVSLLQGKRAIGSRWVYKIKTKPDESIERCKARLVAKCYSQEYGMDYEDTFSHVAKMTIVRTLIAVASSCRCKISQMDVKHAFSNGDPSEAVYMTPPPGVPHQPAEVCKLQNALYGLKQAPRAWYGKFSTYTTDLFDRARLTNKMNADIPLNAKAKDTRANDITYGVHIVGQFADAPTTINWAIILQILRYLQGTQYLMLFILFHTLLFPFTSSLDLHAYCDIDWAGDFVAWKFAPQLHESADGLPKTKLVSHSCSLAGSTEVLWEVSIPMLRAPWQGARVQ
ncbi:putative mitochondrial protein [Tanacetum coccineum]